jgi:hypothetical protein
MSNHTTIEFTKKKYKSQQLLSTLLLWASLGLLFAPGAISADPHTQGGILGWAFIAATIWKIILRVCVWWEHG